MDGFLLISKDWDWTSRAVCNKVSGIFNEKKVGHFGTLDPFATGLLIVALGKATKAGTFLEDLDKTYEAEICLGVETDTGDCDGKEISSKPVPNLTKEIIINALNKFVGEIEQIPPMTSAIHQDGVKLYKLAHKGITVERKPRKVTVHSIKFVEIKNNFLKFEATVSKGTYIRTLGEDIAKELGTVGHLHSLRRLRIGSFYLKDAYYVDRLKGNELISILEALRDFPSLEVDDKTKLDAMNGKQLVLDVDPKLDKILLKNGSEAIAVYQRVKGNLFKSLRGLF